MVEYLQILRFFIVIGIVTNICISNVFAMDNDEDDDWSYQGNSLFGSSGRFSPPPIGFPFPAVKHQEQDLQKESNTEYKEDVLKNYKSGDAWDFNHNKNTREVVSTPVKDMITKSISDEFSNDDSYESTLKIPSTPPAINKSSKRIIHSEERPLRGSIFHGREPVSISKNQKKSFSPLTIQNILKEYADDKGFGNKAANLKILTDLCACFLKENNNYGFNVKVPDFFCISSGVIKSALRDYANFDVNLEWLKVCTEGVEFVSTPKKKLLQKKHNSSEFSKEFLEKRELFEKKMSEAFDVLLKKMREKEITFDLILYDSRRSPLFIGEESIDSLATFLNLCEKKKTKLMVRSTGKEDTKDIANAGGNYTAVGVLLNEIAILEAIKEVELSYFSMKSLSQRLKFGDDSIFGGDEPLVPILLQEMVGAENLESFDQAENRERTKEVVSGVLFSSDPECGEQGGAIVTQAAFGHGEGIVNSLISFDTYYSVLHRGKKTVDIYPVLREKNERMASINGVDGLYKVKNALELVRVSALSSAAVSTLSLFAKFLEDVYGYSLDIEFVVKDNTIFIVQARPIVHKKYSIKPSYLTSEFLATIPDKKKQGISIGVAGGAVRKIEDEKAIIWAQTIGQALSIYLNPEFDSHKIQAVIVGTMAPSTSHEATTFRGEGKPVLFIKQWEELKDKFKDEKILLFDAQQGLVCLINNDEPYQVVEGWCGYPMPRELTVIKDNDFFVSETTICQLQKIGRTNGVSWSRLLSDMKPGSSCIFESLQQYRRQLCDYIERVRLNILIDDKLEDSISAIQQTADVLSQRILRGSNNYMQSLLPIKFLEALTYQQSNGIVVEQNSIAMLVKIMKQEKNSKYDGYFTKGARQFYIQLTKVEEIILDDDLKDKWRVFIKRAARNEERIKQLASFIAELEKTEILATWLHTVFAQDYAPEKTPKNLLTIWVSNYNQDKIFLKIIADILQRIKRVNLTSFAHEKNCNVAWSNFKNELVAFFRIFDASCLDYAKKMYPNVLFNGMPKAGLCGKVAAIQVMRSFVDIFDQIIKTVKGCPDLTQEVKLGLFKEMLQEYFEVLQNWVEHLIPNLIDEKLCGLFGKDFHKNTKEAYLNLLRGIIGKEDFSADDLKPTPGLDVAIFAMGTGHDFVHERDDNVQPERAEDAFSITHQSLLNCCGVLAAAYMGANVQRPALLQTVEQVVRLHETDKNKFALVGVEFLPGEFLLHYNKILENHSCQICLRYHHKERKVSINFHFCGGRPDQVYRWCNEAIFALLASKISENQLEVRLDKLSTYEVSIDFSIKEFQEKKGFSQTQLDLVSSLWCGMMDIATGANLIYENSIVAAVRRYTIFQNSLDRLGSVQQAGVVRELNHFGKVGEDAVASFCEFIFDSFEDITGKELMEFSPDLLCSAIKNENCCDKIINFLNMDKISKEVALQVAQKSAQTDNSIARKTALQIFNILVSRKFAFEEAAAAILACVNQNAAEECLAREKRQSLEVDDSVIFNLEDKKKLEAAALKRQAEIFSMLELLERLVKNKRCIDIIPQVMNNTKVSINHKIYKKLDEIKQLLEKGNSENEIYQQALDAINNF